MNKGKLIVLSAPSGAGKTSICKELLKRNSDWKFSISATTRSLREGEKDGIDYIKMSNEKFELDEILEFFIFRNFWYFFSKIDNILLFSIPFLFFTSAFTL